MRLPDGVSHRPERLSSRGLSQASGAAVCVAGLGRSRWHGFAALTRHRTKRCSRVHRASLA